jgi:hypothetical protein
MVNWLDLLVKSGIFCLQLRGKMADSDPRLHQTTFFQLFAQFWQRLKNGPTNGKFPLLAHGRLPEDALE